MRDVVEIIATLRNDVAELRNVTDNRNEQISKVPPGQPYLNLRISYPVSEAGSELPLAPRISYCEATEFVPYYDGEEITKQVNKLLENNVIEHSNSPYNSPLWIVPKKPDCQDN
ncbi:hypothetical protein P5V15_015631 [Pogonomyrmex californicus]